MHAHPNYCAICGVADSGNRHDLFEKFGILHHKFVIRVEPLPTTRTKR